MLHFRALTLLLALLIFPSLGSADPLEPAATKISIGGSGGPLGTMQILAEAFKKTHPHATIVIVPSLGSSGGMKALLAGALDIAVISRQLKDAERSQGIVVTEYARTPFVFATATQANVSAISTHELVSIYKGERKTWPDGRDRKSVV